VTWAVLFLFIQYGHLQKNATLYHGRRDVCLMSILHRLIKRIFKDLGNYLEMSKRKSEPAA
jgi:hypothetical protein